MPLFEVLAQAVFSVRVYSACSRTPWMNALRWIHFAKSSQFQVESPTDRCSDAQARKDIQRTDVHYGMRHVHGNIGGIGGEGDSGLGGGWVNQGIVVRLYISVVEFEVKSGKLTR
ncbi:hypothetical protein K439DRAFT_1536087 [Ramaria rubella]|nr:hypothetical protein K439DRAFT_1536087 [Ramaria rubella]